MTGRSEQAGEIVFICTGNRARSPLAEALVRRCTSGLPVSVTSRGTIQSGGVPALPEMIRAAHRVGIDLTGHRSQPLRHGELVSADLVIGFEPFHVAAAVVDGGARSDVAFTMLELLAVLDTQEPAVEPFGVVGGLDERVREAHRRRSGRDRLRAPSIADPMGEPQAAFDRLAVEIAAHVERLAVSTLGVRPDAREPTASA